MKKVVLGAIILGLVVSIATGFVYYFSPRQPAATPEPSVEEQLANLFVSAGDTQPKSIYIPSLEITAPVVALGINSEGNFADPDNGADVGWYLGGGYPGLNDPTQAILLNGHLTDQKGEPAVFINLHELQVGDQFQIIRRDLEVYTYTVAETVTLPLEEVDMENLVVSIDPAKEGVTIITCAGEYDEDLATYPQRFIVQAVLSE